MNSERGDWSDLLLLVSPVVVPALLVVVGCLVAGAWSWWRGR